jgi:hypothetical protein
MRPRNNDYYSLAIFSHCLVVGDRRKHLTCLITVRAVIDPLTLEVRQES